MSLPHITVLSGIAAIVEQVSMAAGYAVGGSSQGNEFAYGFVFQPNGDIQRIVDSQAATFIDRWVNLDPPNNDYWIRFSGFTPGGNYTGSTVNTWISMSGSTSCTFNVGPDETFNESVVCEIASDAAGSNILDTTSLGWAVDSGQ